MNEKQFVDDKPIAEKTEQHLNKTEAAKVFGQAFTGKQGPAMLD